jgi:hypothetical protein
MKSKTQFCYRESVLCKIWHINRHGIKRGFLTQSNLFKISKIRLDVHKSHILLWYVFLE